MALLHQPLDLQQAVERRVQVALPGLQQGQSQVAVERPGIEILPCLLQPQPIPVPGLDLAALLQAQARAAQGDPAEHRAALLAEVLQVALGAIEDAFRAQQFAALLQPLRPLQFDQRLEDQAVVLARQAQGIAADQPRLVHPPLDHRQLHQRRAADQSLRPGVLRQLLQRLAQVVGGAALAAAVQEDPEQALPLRQQHPLAGRRGHRQEARQLADAAPPAVRRAGPGPCRCCGRAAIAPR